MAFREIVAPTVKELFIQQLEGMILSARGIGCPLSVSWRMK